MNFNKINNDEINFDAINFDLIGRQVQLVKASVGRWKSICRPGNTQI